MNRLPLIFRLVQILLVACALQLGVWAAMPAMSLAGWLLAGAGLLAAQIGSPRGLVPRLSLVVTWAGAVLALAGSFGLGHSPLALDGYYALPPWLVAVAILTAARSGGTLAQSTAWRILALTLGLVGSALWLAASYLQDRPGEFHFGILTALIWCLLVKSCFRLPSLGIYAVNTLILLLITLPIFDFVLRAASQQDLQPDPAIKYHLYQTAKNNPRAFDRWWKYYLAQMDHLTRLRQEDPRHILPFRLRPGSQCLLGQSLIHINQHGLRGPEIPDEKGAAYRIVTLGESTTFGITLATNDRPWPEQLGQLIRERLQLERPIEVLNAGVPAYNLRDNLHRLASDILPLHPDLLISYHGINGFHLLSEALPRLTGPRPPAYRHRPLSILADCEYALKMNSYRRRHQPAPAPASLPDPGDTPYAVAYRELIQFADTNHIRLALANFSMAVNHASDLDVIQFYRRTFPFVYEQIQANAVHSALLAQLIQQHPQVTFVDTQPRLDGNHDHFLDLIHPAPDGDRQLAENIFTALKPILEAQLGRTNAPSAATEPGRGGAQQW